ncbi:MAG: hypothetical protein ABI251_03400, partial [Mycobacteriaceae bacterium]
WDSNGDGVADTVVLDLDDDGHGDHHYTDPTGAGTWNALVLPPPGRHPDGPLLRWVDSDGYRRSATATIDRDGDGIPESAAVDFDSDGRGDDVVSDDNGDGLFDSVLVDTHDTGTPDVLYSDTTGDGILDTKLVDTDGDGHPDVTVHAGEPGFAL